MDSFRQYMETLSENQNKGTYIGARWSITDVNVLLESIRWAVVDDVLIDSEDAHSTIIYSTANIDNEIDNLVELENQKLKASEDMSHASVKRFSWFGDNENILVLELNSPWLESIHENIMATTNATYDFDVYRPHITLAVGITPEDLIDELPDLTGKNLSIDHFYQQPLIDDFYKSEDD